MTVTRITQLFLQPLPHVEGGYTATMRSDVLNMFLVAIGGRDFALLNTNYSSRVPAKLAASRDEMYATFIGALDLRPQLYKKNLLVCASRNRICKTSLGAVPNIGKLLGYYEPRVGGWEDMAKDQSDIFLQFLDSRNVAIFGQAITKAKLDQACLERYIKTTLNRLNRALSHLSLRARYEILR